MNLNAETNLSNASTVLLQKNWLGLIDYNVALNLQMQEWQKNTNSHFKLATLLGCEHPEVITLGKRTPQLEKEYWLQQHDLTAVEVDRGGEITAHNPGQLVVYPILNLRKHNLTVRELVMGLLNSAIELFAYYEIKAFYDEKDTGVYTQFGKVASVGLRIDKGVSRHGIAINLKNNLAFLQRFKLCGAYHRTWDSLEQHSIAVNTSDAFQLYAEILSHRINPYEDVP